MKIGHSIYYQIHFTADIKEIGFQCYVRHRTTININNQLEANRMVIRIMVKENIHDNLKNNLY